MGTLSTENDWITLEGPFSIDELHMACKDAQFQTFALVKQEAVFVPSLKSIWLDGIPLTPEQKTAYERSFEKGRN